MCTQYNVLIIYVHKNNIGYYGTYKSRAFGDLYIFRVYTLPWLVWSLEYDYVVHENELFGLIYKSTGRINHIFNGWFFKTHVSYPLILHVSKIKDIIITDADAKS